MTEQAPKLRRRVRIQEACRALGVGETRLKELEAEGLIRKRHKLWPGSRNYAYWEDELIEDQSKLFEAVRAEEAAQAEADGAPTPSPTPNDPPRPKSALLNRPRKAARR